MGLIVKALLGKAAANMAGKRVHKVEKSVKRKVKRTKRTFALMALSFCVGAACMGWFIYGHGNTAASVIDALPKSKGKGGVCRRKCFLNKPGK